MIIASVSSTRQGETDRLLTEIADRLLADGKSLAGIVKATEHASQYENGCDMKVRVLPEGPVISITQNLGAGSDACRLDPGAIATVVSTVENRSFDNVDMFILNKFGPEEAAGRGFCAVIGAAVEREIPVLVGVGSACRDAFDAFTGGIAETLRPDLDAILKWCSDVPADISLNSSE